MYLPLVTCHSWYRPWQPMVCTLQWRHNERDGVSNHRRQECVLNRLFRADQRKHQSSASLAFVKGIHRWPVNSPLKGPVTRKMFPFDDVIMTSHVNQDQVNELKISGKYSYMHLTKTDQYQWLNWIATSSEMYRHMSFSKDVRHCVKLQKCHFLYSA